MRARIALITVITASLVFIGAKMVFSEDAAPEQNAQPQETQGEVIQGGAVPETKTEPETQWVWGEVVTVDLANKTVFVKYLDYESDQEKEMAITVGDNTTFENVKSIDELKPKDTVSIDYVSQDGKNVAKNISVEKPETQAAPQVQTPAQTKTPSQMETPPQAQTQPEDVTPTRAPEQQTQPEQTEPAAPSGN